MSHLEIDHGFLVRSNKLISEIKRKTNTNFLKTFFVITNACELCSPKNDGSKMRFQNCIFILKVSRCIISNIAF